MGYTTYFSGAFDFNKPVENEMCEYINKFAEIRHMIRDVEKIKEIYPNWEMLGFCGSLGHCGEYFVGDEDMYDASVIDNNRPAPGVPGLWCQWIITNNQLVWDEGEKFYEYVDWLEYLIKHFFAPNGYVLNGKMEFEGEDSDDFGLIIIKDNIVEVKYGFHIYDLSSIEDGMLINELTRRGYNIGTN